MEPREILSRDILIRYAEADTELRRLKAAAYVGLLDAGHAHFRAVAEVKIMPHIREAQEVKNEAWADYMVLTRFTGDAFNSD